MLVYFILAFLVATVAICLVGISAIKRRFKNKKLNITVLILIGFVLLNIVMIPVVNNADENKLKQELAARLEPELKETIKDFKNSSDAIGEVTYEIRTSSSKSAEVDVYITLKSDDGIFMYNAFDLYEYDSFYYDSMMWGYEKVHISCDVYRNGKWKTSYGTYYAETKSKKEQREENKKFGEFYDAYQKAKDDYYN